VALKAEEQLYERWSSVTVIMGTFNLETWKWHSRLRRSCTKDEVVKLCACVCVCVCVCVCARACACMYVCDTAYMYMSERAPINLSAEIFYTSMVLLSLLLFCVRFVSSGVHKHFKSILTLVPLLLCCV
jgi:hypothetical protein